MKFSTNPTCAHLDAAARKLVRLAKSVKTIQDGRIYIAEIKKPFLSKHGSLNGTSRASNQQLNGVASSP